ncbi:MAG: hypothetical protein J0647_02530 [Campylobacteraceae bacterium]|nr:hypothetical protein [Campylobacteraceae bacterium]
MKKELSSIDQNFTTFVKESNQPIGVATYKLTESLPSEFKDLLPTPAEISERLENLLGDHFLTQAIK